MFRKVARLSRRAFTLTFEAGQPTLWMGLGQVRELRQRSVVEIVRARRSGPFKDVGDLMERVSLQRKELTHLVRCGALDGLGPCRAAIEAQAGMVSQAGSVRQMAFGFAEPQVAPESPDNLARHGWDQAVAG